LIFDGTGQKGYATILKMASFRKHFIGAWCALAAGAAVFSVSAQNSVPDGNQSILATPENGAKPADAASETRKNFFNLGNQIRAPRSIFGIDSGDDSTAPAPPPPINQQPQAKQKSWGEMTPEEIFGLDAPTKDGDSKQLDRRYSDQSPLEKYALQQRFPQAGTTNTSSEGWSFFDPTMGGPNQRQQDDPRKTSGGTPLERMLMGTQAAHNLGGNQDNDWARGFATRQTERPTVEQVKAMDVFQQMLLSSSSDVKSAALGGKTLGAAVIVPDSNFEPVKTGFNPSGSSFAPVGSGISGPRRLDPLPGIVRPAPAVPLIPSWAPKPAPWTVEGPKLFVMPTRKF
jgi:hypothetical protein